MIGEARILSVEEELEAETKSSHSVASRRASPLDDILGSAAPGAGGPLHPHHSCLPFAPFRDWHLYRPRKRTASMSGNEEPFRLHSVSFHIPHDLWHNQATTTHHWSRPSTWAEAKDGFLHHIHQPYLPWWAHRRSYLREVRAVAIATTILSSQIIND